MPKFVITGGGTGGHVFPALAIAQELKLRGNSVLYVGSNRGLEAKLAPQHGIEFVTIESGPVKNQTWLRRLRSVWQVATAIVWSVQLLRQHKPVAVVGVGGYVSVPVGIAAWLLRIPLFLQEQNVSVGIANRVLGRLCRRVFLGFGQAARYFPKGRSLITGNPIRRQFFEATPAYNPHGKRLLILGGSQGARSINQAVIKGLKKLSGDWHITHQTGASDYAAVSAAYESGFRGTARVAPFIEDVFTEMAQATVVVSRSGALTVSELVQVGRPCILVPFPRQGQNDQVDNARWLADAGGALMVEQGEGFEERFWTAWESLQDPNRLNQMQACFSALRQPPALATIATQIEKDLRPQECTTKSTIST